MRRLRTAFTIATIAGLCGMPARAATLRIHVFDAAPSQAYAVTRDGVPVATVNATPAGAAMVSLDAAAGAAVRFHASGTGAVPPSAPTGVTAAGDSIGCAHLAWVPSPETDVVGYRVYVAPASVAQGQAGWVDSVSTATSSADVCGLLDGDWFFAVRAVNASGLLSVPSVEVRASVSTGNAQPPAPPLVLSATGGAAGCIDVVWAPSGDPTVVGYDVAWDSVSAAQGGGRSFVRDAGSTPAATICGLVPGTWYVSVRARNALGMTSAWSAERAVTLVATAVVIAAFDAEAAPDGVALRWDVSSTADAPAGFRVERLAEGESAPAVVTPGTLGAAARAFVDRSVEPRTRYTYWLVARDDAGVETRSVPRTVETPAAALQLDQNVPNPFNPTTTIRFVLPAPGEVRLDVFDVRGSRVATLVDERLDAGAHAATWNGRDGAGRAVASGAYFYRLRAAGRVVTRKMLLVK